MRLLVAAALAGFALIPQADARGGGGGGHGGGGRGGGGHAVGFFNAGNFGFQNVARPGFPGSRHVVFSRRVTPFVKHQVLVANRHLIPFRHFAGNRFDGWGGQQWAGDGGFGWPAWGWNGGGSAGYAAPVAQAPTDPQVIVVSASSPTRQVAVAEPATEYNVGGCRPIPNGYHCGP
jgi:hypothetical protein